MFKIVPTLYQARLDAEAAERDLAKLEYNYTQKLSEKKVVSTNEVLLLGAKLAKAAKATLAGLNWTCQRQSAPSTVSSTACTSSYEQSDQGRGHPHDLVR